nr:hypothetical protein Itr_chr14CG11000 [Ipomoea trifida]GMD87045.1 hypothetical protein Iba_chr14bCG11970 [Ipomoea batatas]GMD88205.1 hypothetical protein Iba_chr14cCG4840 [Ipomoea batatas]GME07559.1 hypothetical protein Iba_scaffold6333CG0230 [Ipomoea batatas]GME10080.1 hypothetical protein Iba_scaffold9471CG0040 [Ipomoea batatas]
MATTRPAAAQTRLILLILGLLLTASILLVRRLEQPPEASTPAPKNHRYSAMQLPPSAAATGSSKGFRVSFHGVPSGPNPDHNK